MSPYNAVHFLLSAVMKALSSINFFFMAPVVFPRVQRRARAELDVVVGRDRLPTFNDRPRLPYTTAPCKELMRWQMATPIGTSRSLLTYGARVDDLQDSHTCQVGMMFTEAISFRKVRFFLISNCSFRFSGKFLLIHLAKRNYNDGQYMVSHLAVYGPNNLNVYLIKISGNPSRPRDIPRPREI